jgi:trans-aconitate methyltransferase
MEDGRIQSAESRTSTTAGPPPHPARHSEKDDQRAAWQRLDTFRPTGSVLELACGPGIWTTRLLRHAADVTAMDASTEMIAIASARVGRERVRFVSANLFHWRPDRRYDVVFFGAGRTGVLRR